MAAVNIKVKNTFLCVDKQMIAPLRPRSNSIPPTWKPGKAINDDDAQQIDDSHSTSASDGCVPMPCTASNFTETDSQDVTDDESESECIGTGSLTGWPVHEGAKSLVGASAECLECDSTPSGYQNKAVLSLADSVPEEVLYPAGVQQHLSLSDSVPPEWAQAQQCWAPQPRTKLKSYSQPFVSVREPPTEIKTIIASVVASLANNMDIVNVKVKDQGMGGLTIIMAESSNPEPDATWAFSLAKDALLSAAEQSETTYVIGYGDMPFKKLDNLSFSANIGCVPEAHADSACWEFYEWGVCPRCTTCRWNHPAKTDMMEIICMITKGGRQGFA